MAGAVVQVDGASLRALEGFRSILEARQAYLGETAEASVRAMMVDSLKSLRTTTKVAKVSGIKVAVERNDAIKVSYFTQGGVRKMCFRFGNGARLVGNAEGKQKFVECHGRKLKDLAAYTFDDTEGDARYLIAAPSKGTATKSARQIVASRVMRYRGLARRAISALMIKTHSRAPADTFGRRVAAKAYEVTRTRETWQDLPSGGGVFSLRATDDLHYAKSALKGGASDVDRALMASANKAAGRIQHCCKDLLKKGALKTPFPEIQTKKRRAS